MTRILQNVNRLLADNKYTLFVSLVTGLLIAVLAFYFRPVVTMQGEIASRTEDSVTLHVWGKKHRATCKFLGISGYAAKNGVMRDAEAVRVDMPEDGSTKPAGVFDIGYWLIFPLGKADKVLMYVTHSCGPGDIRVTKIAEVEL